MTTNIPFTLSDARSPQPAGTRAPWIERCIWLSLVLVLCAANGFTLLDRGYRNSAYDAVAHVASRSALESVGLSRIAKLIEDGNPVVLEKAAIARATGRLAESNVILEREVADLKKQRFALAVDRLNLQKQLRFSRAAIALHRDRMSALGKKVLGRAARSVARHLAALPGHALPVLSATVAVAGVALDIQDACESLKELDDLNHGAGLASVNRSTVCGRIVPGADMLLAEARDNWRKVYAASAEALNAGAQIIPRTPPPISFESAQKWLSATLGR